MANKTKNTAKRDQRHKKQRRIEPPYSCENAPKPPLSLYEIQELIMKDQEFAQFFSEQLCTSSMGGKGSRAATKCVQAWYKPIPEDLYTLCIPEKKHARLLRCTDQNLLISPVAYKFAKRRSA